MMVEFEIPAGLLARCAGQTEICKRVINKYVEQMRTDVMQLSQFVESSDTASIQKLAHRIKGASSNVAAEELRQAAHEIENLASNNNLDDTKPFVTQLQTLWAEYEAKTESLRAQALST